MDDKTKELAEAFAPMFTEIFLRDLVVRRAMGATVKALSGADRARFVASLRRQRLQLRVRPDPTSQKVLSLVSVLLGDAQRSYKRRP